MPEIGDFRKSKGQYFGGDPNSPLTPEQRKGYKVLKYFAENANLQFALAVEEYPDDSKGLIQMATSSGDPAPHNRWGQLKFVVGGAPVALTVYRDEDGGDYFLPFMGATTGDDSYSDGRYLDQPLSRDGRLVLDLNYAYNTNWSCPIPRPTTGLR